MFDRFHEHVDEAIGQAPDDLAPGSADFDARELGVGCMRRSISDVAIRIEDLPDRKPERVGYLALFEDERARVRRVIDVGGDHETVLAESRIALEISQRTQVLGAAEGHTDLLQSFALGRSPRVQIDRFDATTRKRHVARPWVAGAGRSFDEENLDIPIPLAQDQRHRSLMVARDFDAVGLEALETRTDVIQIGHGATIAR